MPLTLYVKTGCPWCTEAEEVLDRNGISYDRIDVLRDKKAFQYMREISGQNKAPTLEWEDRILSDFGADELTEFLRENNLAK
jgi:glutaredoxin 3